MTRDPSRPQQPPQLELRDVEITYPGAAGAPPVRAVRGIDLRVEAGEAVGLFGESGSGKSSLALAVLSLLPAGSERRGEIRFAGERLDGLGEASWRRIRGRRIGLVFQQPSLALHPLRSVGSQLVDVLSSHTPLGRGEIRERSAALFRELELEPEHLSARPHQLSGGQQQRACLALALAAEPSLLIADEPTTALDSETEDRVLDLLRRLRLRRRLSLLVISHDPAVLERLSTRLYALCAGRVIEEGPTSRLLESPRHPHLTGLLAHRSARLG
ncbi:MAG: ATP-binding cassette domain-containing protein [Acidobacteriota bacterium]